MILAHHEKMDGSGYPFGLEKNDLLLESKILQVAEVVSGIASAQLYRPGMGAKAALEEVSVRPFHFVYGLVVQKENCVASNSEL